MSFACEFQTKTNRKLKTHKNSQHMDMKNNCNICGYQGSTNSNLRKHNKSIHMGKKHPCGECDFIFL